MATYSYSTVPSKLTDLLQKIQGVGIPQAANLEWLKAIGFVGSNDRTLLTVLKFIGFADSSGKPTDNWKHYRNKDSGRKALAKMLRDSYENLFLVYDDAHLRSEQELANYFTTATSSGAQAVSKTVATFKTLCTLADFSGTLAEPEAELSPPPSNKTQRVAPEPETELTRRASIMPPEIGGNVTINLNIQLTLPAEMDRAGYGEFFAALRKHLMEPYKDTDDK